VSSIPNEIVNNGKIKSGDKNIANEFAEFFEAKSNKIVKECKINKNVYNGESILQIFDENFMTETRLNEIFKTIKPKK